MPPYLSKGDDEGYIKPFSFLHPDARKGKSVQYKKEAVTKCIGKTTFQEPIHQPHVFQQSVTLTASIWNEEEAKENMENWNLVNWKVFAQYSPLVVGLFCGFGIVLLIMSTVVLWRYCLLSATKKVCCRGTYGEMTTQQKNTLPLRKDKTDNQNGFENFKNLPVEKPTLQRSATFGSIPWNNTWVKTEGESKFSQLRSQGFPSTRIPSNPNLHSAQFEPLMSQDNLYTSHLYLQKLGAESSNIAKTLSKSTPALEDLYAKVNFSKKRKNRMRKDEAAIIAMSKSHSGQNNSSLAQFGSAIVVYNERTAL